MQTLNYQPELEGKKVQYQYKQTSQTRKWRDGFIHLCYGEIAYQYGRDLQLQEGYNQARFVEYK